MSSIVIRVTLPAILEPVSADEACCAPTATSLGTAQAEELARTFKALSDPTRIKLISIVAGSKDFEACVCDLTEPVGLSQPTVSHHLKILTDAGFFTRSQRGNWAYYRLVEGALDRVAPLLASAVGR